MRDVKTIVLRLLVPADVNEEFFVEQLVTTATGSGAPVGGVLLLHNSHGELVPSWGRVVTRPNTEELSSGWAGERVEPLASID